jgi:myosin heavy subunit
VLLYFTQAKGEILGARVKNYLLEKSRVVGPAPNERNYHVFYHLLRGADEDLLDSLGLLEAGSQRRLDKDDFKYLKDGGDVDPKIIDDVELYQDLEKQF